MLNRQSRPNRADERPLQRSRWNPRHVRVLAGSVCQAADLILLGVAILGVTMLPNLRHDHGSFAGFLLLRVSLRNVFVAAMCISTWRIVLISVGVYSPLRTRSLTDYLFRCVIGLNSCTGVVGLIEVVLRPGGDVWHTVEFFWIAALCMTASLRLGLLLFDWLPRSIVRGVRNLVILGSGERAQQVFEACKLHTEWDYRVVGFVDSEPQGHSLPSELVLGGMDQLEQILMHTAIDEVVIALPINSRYEAVDGAINTCRTLGIQVQHFTDCVGITMTASPSSASSDVIGPEYLGEKDSGGSHEPKGVLTPSP